MRKILLIFVAVLFTANPVFAKTEFKPYTEPLSNVQVGSTAIEFENSNIKISRNKYKIDVRLNKYLDGYEYFIENKTNLPITLKKMMSPDIVYRDEVNRKFAKISWLGDAGTTDELDNIPGVGDVRTIKSQLESLKFTRPLPYNYTIQSNDTVRVLIFGKKNKTPDIEFQFMINNNISNIILEHESIVKDQKYYDNLVASQNYSHDSYGLTSHIDNKNVLMVEAYLNTGVTVDDKYVLFHAMTAGVPKITEMVLNAGANPNQKCLGYYPAYQAIIYDQPEVLELLLDAGANPNTIAKGRTLLHWSIRKKHPEMAKLLIDKKAEVNEISGKISSLAYAIKKKQLKTVQYLLGAGAKIDEEAIKYAKKSKDENIKNLVLLKLK